MKQRRRAPYNERVKTMAWRQALAGLLAIFALVALAGTRAWADPVQLPSTGTPVIYVRLASGSLTINTWDRTDVQIDGDPTVRYNAAPPEQVAGHLPQEVTLWEQTITTLDGAQLQLPPEPFVLPPLRGSTHDGVILSGEGALTLTIPSTTALIVANVRQGDITLGGYTGGTFVMHVGVGLVHLNGVGGNGAVQVNNGPVFAKDSTFDRLRIRTGRGNMFFENCHARDIQATSLLGSILYDNGSFEPGLARFESERGNIALGVGSGGAQINAHSTSGHIFSENETGAHPSADAQSLVGGGGPIVTATSGSGSVMYYKGSLRAHPALQRRLPANMRTFVPRRRRPPGRIP